MNVYFVSVSSMSQCFYHISVFCHVSRFLLCLSVSIIFQCSLYVSVFPSRLIVFIMTQCLRHTSMLTSYLSVSMVKVKNHLIIFSQTLNPFNQFLKAWFITLVDTWAMRHSRILMLISSPYLTFSWLGIHLRPDIIKNRYFEYQMPS